MNIDIKKIKDNYGIISNDTKYIAELEKAVKVAKYDDLNILIVGENGVGKDVFSRIIHDYSPRNNEKLISVNCGALPKGTIESELFGHVRGAFTGAERDRKGYFEEANKGTIFLDEIGDLPLPMQVKLLRVIENGEIMPVGSSENRKINVRIIAATNIDMNKALLDGKFRQDLYYRISQIVLHIPPLRERKDDIRWLFRTFAGNFSAKYKTKIPSLTNEAKETLKNYSWPGNIRQLKNFTEQICANSPDETSPYTITKDIVLQILSSAPDTMIPVLVNSNHEEPANAYKAQINSIWSHINEMQHDIAVLNETLKNILNLPNNANISLPAQTNNETSDSNYITNIQADGTKIQIVKGVIDNDNYSNDVLGIQDNEITDDDSLSLAKKEKMTIISALKQHRTRNAAAKALGISERTLYRKIKDYDIQLKR